MVILDNHSTNEEFKNILNDPRLRWNFGFKTEHYKKNPKLADLYARIANGHNILSNPFCCNIWKLKELESLKDLEDINIFISSNNHHVELNLFDKNNHNYSTFFIAYTNKHRVSYNVNVPCKNGLINMYHSIFYRDSKTQDKILYELYDNSNSQTKRFAIDLYESKAWKNYAEEITLTEEHLNEMIKYLKFCNDEIYDKVIRHIIEVEA